MTAATYSGSSSHPEPDPADAAWYRSLNAELTAHGLSPKELERIVADARAEADSAGIAPANLFGPAVLFARELASAMKEGDAAGRDTGHALGPVVLRLHDVTLRRGRRTVLSNFSLTVRRSEIVAVVGSNGAGKSTLLQACAGLLPTSSGRVERTERFGYAPQLDALAPLLTVDEHLRLFGALDGANQDRAVPTGHQILHRLGWRPNGEQITRTLSGGTQQKLNLALAQLTSPELLLLDEPYQGLDALAYEDLWTLISAWRSSGAGVLLVTHLLRDIDFVDRVVELPAPESYTEAPKTKERAV
ncbi:MULTISPECIES: ATP-binding cassette domain-containing protein [unclassified Actinomyces]|uniref:ATP-binding cassette domain-containing protein n=1 Tax=unclassified Actinomyces TaxID=2609248 RepID=UPI000D59FC28|nr:MULTISPECIES: ABC transporter ATP-binding protein [unclassified Actinomyces]RAX20827.1 ABC transporter ATP-binding protein [Actinomyces sp. Z3]